MTINDLAQAVGQVLVGRGAVRHGRHLRFLCVAHPDRRPSADYEPERGLWVCRSCGVGGGVRDLARRLGIDPGVSASRAKAPRPRIPAPPPGLTRKTWGPAWRALLEQARREDHRLARCHELFVVSDWLRRRSQLVADAHRVASALGDADPRAWALLARASRVQTAADMIASDLDGVGPLA
jgi:hypothetical protein